MKQKNLMIACSFAILSLMACDNAGTDADKKDSPSMKNDSANNSANMPADNTGNNSTTNNTTLMAALSAQDSMFAMKAAEGGMMEVESGNIALQNSTNERVRNFASMMVADHGKANSELMSLASKHGMSLLTSLPADKQQHLDVMKKMQGKAFDKHYIDMMMNDHKKAISDFEKEASGGADSELKAWAGKTVPTLKMHRDSVTALSKMKL